MHILQSLIRPMVISVVVPIMVACAGIWLTDHYQERAWHRQTSFELFRANYDRALETIDELSQVMGGRFFGLMRVTWADQGTGTRDLDSVWDEYYSSVQEWNMKKMHFKNRVARAVGDEMADLFADLKSDQRIDSEAASSAASVSDPPPPAPSVAADYGSLELDIDSPPDLGDALPAADDGAIDLYVLGAVDYDPVVHQ